MIYYAKTELESGHFLLMDFPDFPGCQTFVDLNMEESKKPWKVARDALHGHVQTMAMLGKKVPKPSYKGPGVMIPLSGHLQKLLTDCNLFAE